MLTVVSRRHKNEAMGVGSHGSCTVIALSLQGRGTHGSRTQLVGLSKLCGALGAITETPRSEPQKHIHAIVCFKDFLLSLQAPIISVFKKKVFK